MYVRSTASTEYEPPSKVNLASPCIFYCVRPSGPPVLRVTVGPAYQQAYSITEYYYYASLYGKLLDVPENPEPAMLPAETG